MGSPGLYSSLITVNVDGVVINEPISGGGGGTTGCASCAEGFMLASICDKFDGIAIFAKTFAVGPVVAPNFYNLHCFL